MISILKRGRPRAGSGELTGIRVRGLLIAMTLFALGYLGCDSATEYRGSTGTGMPDAGGLPEVPRRTSIVQTAGGGVISSERYKAGVSIGAPEPIGSAESEKYSVTLGPAADR